MLINTRRYRENPYLIYLILTLRYFAALRRCVRKKHKDYLKLRG